MNHRQDDPSFGRDEPGERGRDFERNRRFQQQSGRDFYPGDYGFQDSGQSDFGREPFGQNREPPYQTGQGNYQRAAQQQSGGDQYGRRLHADGQYSGIGEHGERGGYGQGQQQRWQQQRDHYGQGREQRWGGEYGDYGQGQRGGDLERGWDQPRGDWSTSGYYPPSPQGASGGYGGAQRGYGSSFYGEGGGYSGGQPHRREERRGFLGRLFKRGPKGYQRSDERLREDISERLMYAMHIDSSEVTVAVVGGKVTLEGTVPDRFMKHAIEDLVDECPGVQDIENRVRVQSQETERQSSSQEQGARGASTSSRRT